MDRRPRSAEEVHHNSDNKTAPSPTSITWNVRTPKDNTGFLKATVIGSRGLVALGEIYYSMSGLAQTGSRMLTGKRIILRAPEREDLKSFHKWQNDEEVMTLARSMPDHVKSMVSIEAEMEKGLKGEDPEVRRYVIQEKSSGKAIGWSSIRFHTWGSQIPQRPPRLVHWRQGQVGQRIRDRSYQAPTRGSVRTTEPSQGGMVDLRGEQSEHRPGEEARIQRRRSATRPGFLQQPVSRRCRSWPVEEPVRQATP